MDADALLPHHDGADLGFRSVLDQMVDRIAAEDLDSLAPHDFRNGGAELHGVSLPGRGRLLRLVEERGSGNGGRVKRWGGRAVVGQLCTASVQSLLAAVADGQLAFQSLIFLIDQLLRRGALFIRIGLGA